MNGFLFELCFAVDDILYWTKTRDDNYQKKTKTKKPTIVRSTSDNRSRTRCDFVDPLR